MKKLIILFAFILGLSACESSNVDSPPAVSGFSTLEVALSAGQNYECSASQCSCDSTAGDSSTRTCIGMADACRRGGAETVTCGLTGKKTCTCDLIVFEPD